jgi:pantoate--beta-alanine ligase
MRELVHPADLRAWLREHREAGRQLGFVPTMGFLHRGHLALVDEARRRSDVVLMSIFVNPLQFGPNEDLSRYPRDIEHDRALAGEAGVDAIFLPEVETMYPPGSEVRVVPGRLAERWEGAARPGHFTGVLTVVAKLFNLVQPDVAVFGQKDIQQATLIRRMVLDLDFGLELVVAPTVREADGLALSSRNVYLSPEDRGQAVGLNRALAAAHRAWQGGARSGPRLEGVVRETLRVYPGLGVDYIAVVSPDTLEPVTDADASTIVALAARVGRTRLIDNIVLGEGVGACSAI